MPEQCCATRCIGPVSRALLRRDETGNAFAGLCERWLETGDTFAAWSSCVGETAVTFARGKRGFFGCSGLALAMVVSLLRSGRRAVVPSVSSASWAAVAPVVAVSCGQRERCRKWLDGFNPAKLSYRVSEKMRHAPLFQ